MLRKQDTAVIQQTTYLFTYASYVFLGMELSYSHVLILWSPVSDNSMQLGYELQYMWALVRVPCRTIIGTYNPLVCLLRGTEN